jgi:hypothetical protein
MSWNGCPKAIQAKTNHFVPSLGPIQYPHECRIQGRGYALRESRDAGRQIFHQQRSWFRTSDSIRVPLVSGSSAGSVLPVQACRRRRPFGRCVISPLLTLQSLRDWYRISPPVATRRCLTEMPCAPVRCHLPRVLCFEKWCSEIDMSVSYWAMQRSDGGGTSQRGSRISCRRLC